MNKKLLKLLSDAVDICRSYGLDITVDTVIERWSEPHRYWHVLDHLYDMLIGIKELSDDKKINDREYNILVIAAIFHDIVYNTKRKDNEKKSVDYMLSTFNANLIELKVSVSDWRVEADTAKVAEIIMGTKTHDSNEAILKKFNILDTWILDAQFIDMLDWENKIYKEYRWVGWKQYKKGRIQFLLSCLKDHTRNVINIKNLIDYINKKVPKVGIIYYDINKLPSIDDFNVNNKKIEKLFDDVIIVIVFDRGNYDKDKIKEYAICSDNEELYALSDEAAVGFIERRVGDVTIVKELKFMNSYNKDVEEELSKRIEDFRTIYI